MAIENRFLAIIDEWTFSLKISFSAGLIRSSNYRCHSYISNRASLLRLLVQAVQVRPLFLKLLTGIEQADKGDVQLGETWLAKLNGNQRRALRQRSIGYVFQDFKLIEYLNVEENILTPWRLSETSGHSRVHMKARVSSLMDRLGLVSLKHRYPGKLSQGERQRTAIARALLLKPGLVIADEPTGNLDPDNTILVRDLLLSEITQQGATLIVVTHDRSLIEGFDRVIDFADFQSKTPVKAKTI